MARVLIVDDSKTARTVIRAILENIGHEIIAEAATGLEGYDLYFEHKPDVMLLDITMPVFDGVQTFKKIREHDTEAKIILVTSNVNNDKLNEAISAGVSGFIFKPVVPAELEERIKQILNI